jgi:triosephosphate isomerase
VKPLVFGNWKMNHGPRAAAGFCEAFVAERERFGGALVALFPPFLSLGEVASRIAGSGIGLGAQDCHPEISGAFTGEVSAEMLAEAGCRWILVGHSERRHVLGDDDELVRAKLEAVWRAGLEPVLCVGEKLEEREAGRTEEVLRRQCRSALEGRREVGGLVLAYEPVWAIGTGRTATPEQAVDAHRFLRGELEGLGLPAADRIPILYGGSVKPDNVAELVSGDQVAGVLVGGASLEAAGFARLAEEAARATA